MKEYIYLVLIVLRQDLVTSKQDAPTSVSCNMKLLTWNQAVHFCANKGGNMLSYRTVLGVDVGNLCLTSELDVWTADYLTNGTNEYCGFNYLNNTTFQNSEVYYGDCKSNRNYFCQRSEQGNLVVYNGTREEARCNYTISKQDLQNSVSVIKSGFYWIRNITTGKEVEGTGTHAVHCGTYSSSFGKYYSRCDRQLYSLCGVTVQTTKKMIDEINFATKTEQPTINSSKMLTETSSATTAEQPITAVLNVVNNMSCEENIQIEEENTDTGIKVGVPVGIVLPVICGILIVIYIYRKRIKWCQPRKETHENGRINHFHTQETLQIHGQANVYTEGSQDTPISSDVSAEYAVVMKPKKDKISSRLEKYSEKTSNNVTYDEYDTTVNFQSGTSNSSNDLYNHLESDDYNTASVPKRQGERNDMYNTTTRSNNIVESAYDSTTQMKGSSSPDDVYNHLSQNENSYDSTSYTRNNR